MEKLTVTYRFQPNTIENLQMLIDFLIQGKEILNKDEDSELVFVCEPDLAIINIGLAKLKPTETYNPKAPYEVIPGEFMTLYGKLDLIDENGEWSRLYPPPPNE